MIYYFYVKLASQVYTIRISSWDIRNVFPLWSSVNRYIYSTSILWLQSVVYHRDRFHTDWREETYEVLCPLLIWPRFNIYRCRTSQVLAIKTYQVSSNWQYFTYIVPSFTDREKAVLSSEEEKLRMWKGSISAYNLLSFMKHYWYPGFTLISPHTLMSLTWLCNWYGLKDYKVSPDENKMCPRISRQIV
jgi:hypothetical protein